MRRLFVICLLLVIVPALIGEVRGEEMLEIEKIILRHEGFRAKPYKCTAGKLTVGIGRNLEDRGITKDEAMILLRNDIAECEADLFRIFPKLFDLSDNRRWALIDMRFNLGPERFRLFTRMIKAVKANDFIEAARQARDSMWYRQVGCRGDEVVAMILDEQPTEKELQNRGKSSIMPSTLRKQHDYQDTNKN